MPEKQKIEGKGGFMVLLLFEEFNLSFCDSHFFSDLLSDCEMDGEPLRKTCL